MSEHRSKGLPVTGAGRYAKAIVGAIVAALAVLISGVDDGLSAREWMEAASAFLVVLGSIWAVPNRDR